MRELAEDLDIFLCLEPVQHFELDYKFRSFWKPLGTYLSRLRKREGIACKVSNDVKTNRLQHKKMSRVQNATK